MLLGFSTAAYTGMRVAMSFAVSWQHSVTRFEIFFRLQMVPAGDVSLKYFAKESMGNIMTRRLPLKVCFTDAVKENSGPTIRIVGE